MVILKFEILFSSYNMYCEWPIWNKYHDTVLSALGNNVWQLLIPQRFENA